MTKSVLAKQEGGTIQLTITIPVATINETYKEVVVSVTKNAEIPGFRKGKAPQNIVNDKIDKNKIYEEVIEKIVPQAYLESIKEHKLNPILSPKVELLKAKEGEDWEVRITTCEAPLIDLGDYKDKVKSAITSSKLWTPGNTEAQKKPESTEEEKTLKAIEALLTSVKITIPEVIIEDEINHSLSGLINQTNSLGMTIEQYLTSIGKTADQLKSEYREKITKDLTVQLSLNKIAQEEKLEVAEKEITDFVNALGDQKAKDEFSNPDQQLYLKSILLRRKALDFISHL